MTITRRSFGRAALALLALGTPRTAFGQTRKDPPVLNVTPFQINIPDSAIADLKARLAQTRWPHAITDDWSRGQPTSLIRELADQWRDAYDWRQQ